jgi:hypothetical protein
MSKKCANCRKNLFNKPRYIFHKISLVEVELFHESLVAKSISHGHKVLESLQGNLKGNSGTMAMKLVQNSTKEA